MFWSGTMGLFWEMKRLHSAGLIRPRLFLLLFSLACVHLNCATVGPDFVPPEAVVESEWLEADDGRVKTEPTDYNDWWTVFDDPTLNSLIDKACQQSLTLRIAGLRILEARAELGIIVGDLSKIEAAIRKLGFKELSVVDTQGKPVTPQDGAP